MKFMSMRAVPEAPRAGTCLKLLTGLPDGAVGGVSDIRIGA